MEARVRIVNRQYDVYPRTNRLLPRQKRISITFRKIRHEPCRCDYKEFCDWDRNGEMAVPSASTAARALECNYVADVYERIAPHFDETRHAVWTGVKRFLDSVPRGSLLYDIGCGNGKYLLPERNDGLIKIGCDRCLGLCGIAAAKGCCVVRGDALGVPLRSETADAVISIAVLHHMSTEERRRKAIEEIASLLRVGGRACITVWSLEQGESEYAKMRENKDENGGEKKTKKKGIEDGVENEETCNRLVVHDGRMFTQQDLLVPWTVSGKEARKKKEEEPIDNQGHTVDAKPGEEETFLRFYHVFAEGELDALVSSIPSIRLERIELEQGNWVAVFERIA